MSGWGKYVAVALLMAVTTHFVIIFATPNVLMDVVLKRLGSANAWHLAERVT
jgi:hypothetical protein